MTMIFVYFFDPCLKYKPPLVIMVIQIKNTVDGKNEGILDLFFFAHHQECLY
jgi:hypothetical protein